MTPITSMTSVINQSAYYNKEWKTPKHPKRA